MLHNVFIRNKIKIVTIVDNNRTYVEISYNLFVIENNMIIIYNNFKLKLGL